MNLLLRLAPITAALVVSWSCGEPRVVADLIARFPEARKQPADTTFDVADVAIDGIRRQSIVAHGQSRLTTVVTVPKHAAFSASVAVHPSVWEGSGDGVLFLVGVSDGRTFQTKATVLLDPINRPADRRWRDVSVSLEEFAGLTVHLVLNTRAGAAGDANADNDVAVWGSPAVLVR